MGGAVLAALAVGLWGTAQDRASGASAGESGSADRPVSREIVRELPELRTRTSRTYLTADGGRLAELSTAPVNFREDGRWKPIDTTLEPDAAGRLRNRAGDSKVVLPEDLGGTVRLSHRGRSVGFRLKDAAGERSVSGPSAIYRAARPGLDVRYDVLADGVKETLVLKDGDAPRRFRFSLDVSTGLEVVSTAAGGLEMRASDGETKFAMPAPVAWDAASGSTPSESSVRMSYDPQTGEIELRVADEYLDDPERTFPVSVDPWIVVQPPVRDCTLSARSGEQQTSFCGTDLMAGTVGGAEHRAVLHFDAVNQLPEHATILDAYVKLRLKSQDSTAWEDWTIHGLTRPWANNEVSWQQATATTAWTTPGGDVSPTLDPVKRVGGGAGGVDTFWPVNEQIQASADGAAADHGLLIKGAGADPANGLVFSSGEDPDPAKRPKLSIYYEPVMGTDGPFSFVYENLGGTRAGVNVASGRLTITDTDATVNAGPPAFDLQRTYNSADERSNKLGLGWRLEAYAKLETGPLAAIVHMPSGTALRFVLRDDDTYAPARGSDANLTETSAGHVLQLEEPQQRLHFDGNGRLLKREDIATGQHVSYAYNSQGRIATITDAAQGVTTVNYDPTWGVVTSIDLPGGRTATYDVRSNALRSRTIDGATTHYSYDAEDRLARIVAPEGTVKFAYDDEGRVTAMTRVTDSTADTGPTTQFDYYGREALGSCQASMDGRTVQTPPGGGAITHCSDDKAMIRQTLTGATPPTLALSGALYAQRGGELAPGTHALAFEANDAAGIAKTEVLIDGQVLEEAGGQGTWDLDTYQLLPGQRIVSVRATDNDGHVSTEHFLVTIPTPPPPPEWQEDEPTAANKQPLTGAPCEAHYDVGSRFCVEPASSVITTQSVFTTELIYGISHDDNPDSAASFLAREEFDPASPVHLPVKRFRRVVPYNIMSYPGRVAEFRRFYEAAIAYEDRLRANPGTEDQRVDFMVSFWFRCDRDLSPDPAVNDSCFQQSNFDHRPTVNEYLQGVRAFKDAFPRVRWMSAFNEPNGPQSPFRSQLFGARQAVVLPYYLERDVCARVQPPSTPCQVVAADLAQDVQVGGWLSYLREYVDAFQDRRNRPDAGRFPAHWGFHPYVDVKEESDPDPPTDVAAARRRIGSFRFIEAAPANSRIWFSEVGSRIDSGRNTLSKQSDEIDYLIDDLATSNGNSSDPRARIDRVYYYSFCAPDVPDSAPDATASQVFDSGLVGGSVPNRADCLTQPRRPAFTVYRDRATRNPYG